ncbi:unnamed protein product [Brugia timori]|uniref:KR domain-containing protein n=1 Tax=Brugia timori TaxID=42155 RepID=A0A0R3QCN9_9BILA|nr:unnamed protein product [Brugia timori]
MAGSESITRAGGPFGSLTSALVGKVGEQAFNVAAHMVLEEPDPGQWETPAQFAATVAQAFEALLLQRVEREGHGFMAPGSGQWAEERLEAIPRGWRPSYEVGRVQRQHAKAVAARAPKAAIKAAVTSSWLFGGRSEAEGGGEAPLQSGARID